MGFFRGLSRGFEGAGVSGEFKQLFGIGSEPVGLVKARQWRRYRLRGGRVDQD